MIKEFKEFSTNAILKIGDVQLLEQYTESRQLGLFTFIWANKTNITIKVDNVTHTILPDQILSLTPIHRIEFIEGSEAIVYQFNREFYCIKDHDKEVGCVGLLFFGNSEIPLISLTAEEAKKFQLLHLVFLDELDTEDNIQAEMLRMLMARFIIKTTRIIKGQSSFQNVYDEKLDLIRNFNVLVETHFRKEHSVAFYADLLYKAPKTLSNIFSGYEKSPLQVIHDRIVLEAKRLLTYTNKSAKEIAYEIGFDDASHLSRLFKKQTGHSPSEFRKRR